MADDCLSSIRISVLGTRQVVEEKRYWTHANGAMVMRAHG